MRFLSIFILSIFAPIFALAESVTITGTAGTFFHGQKIYLTAVNEALLGSKSLIAETQVGITGDFSFTTESNSILSVEIISAFVTYPFKIQPGGTYTIQLDNPKTNEYISVANTAVKEVLFFNLGANDINRKIINFNLRLDSLLDSELANFNPRSYTLQLGLLYDNYENEESFFKQYAQSAIASQMLNFSKDKNVFFQSFIKNKNLSTDVSESCNLLSKFYEDALSNLLRFESASSKEKILDADASAYYTLFKKWDFTPTPFLRDFAAVYNAYTGMHNKIYTQAQLIDLLANLKPMLADKEAIQIVNAIEKELGLRYEKVIQPMVNNVKIDFTKKALVLCFYSMDSEISRREMVELEGLIKNENLPLQVVKYCTDCSTNLSKGNEIPLAMDPLLFDSLRLYSLPKFTLVTLKGELLKEFLEPPSHGAEQQIKQILSRRDRF